MSGLIGFAPLYINGVLALLCVFVLPGLAFRLVQPVLARHPFTRHDGQLSIRRAYTPPELRALAAAAGLEGARVYTHWPWRMTLVVDHPAHG